jgi:hypothetical protein
MGHKSPHILVGVGASAGEGVAIGSAVRGSEKPRFFNVLRTKKKYKNDNFLLGSDITTVTLSESDESREVEVIGVKIIVSVINESENRKARTQILKNTPD